MRRIIQTQYKNSLQKSIKAEYAELIEISERFWALNSLPINFDELLNKINPSLSKAWVPRHPVDDKPIYQVSSFEEDFKDPSLNASKGFLRARGDKEPMIVTADFESLTRISEVIFKKLNIPGTEDYLVNKFRLEYQKDDEWKLHGEFETGMKEEDDIDHAYHIKLDKPILSSQVRIVIEDNMVTDPDKRG